MLPNSRILLDPNSVYTAPAHLLRSHCTISSYICYGLLALGLPPAEDPEQDYPYCPKGDSIHTDCESIPYNDHCR